MFKNSLLFFLLFFTTSVYGKYADIESISKEICSCYTLQQAKSWEELCEQNLSSTKDTLAIKEKEKSFNLSLEKSIDCAKDILQIQKLSYKDSLMLDSRLFQECQLFQIFLSAKVTLRPKKKEVELSSSKKISQRVSQLYKVVQKKQDKEDIIFGGGHNLYLLGRAGDGSDLTLKAKIGASQAVYPCFLDFDKDGYTDIVTYNEGKIQLIKYYPKSESAKELLFESSRKFSGIVVENMDSDNDFEMIAWNSNFMYTFSQIDKTSFKLLDSLKFDEEHFYFTPTVKIADLNKDGYKDIIFQSSFVDFNKRGLVWCQNKAGTYFDVPNQIIKIKPEGSIKDFLINDFDNNNQLDVIISSVNGIQFFGNFTEREQFQTRHFLTKRSVDESITFKIIDLNKDGQLDFLAVNDWHSIDLYLNLNDANFERKKIDTKLSRLGNITNLEVIDLDNDGLEDLLFSSDYGKQLKWLRQLRELKFQEIPQLLLSQN